MVQRHEEVVLIPPTLYEIDQLPVIADTQYLEANTSESLNRKLCGIVDAGIYRGFTPLIVGNTMTVNITSGQEYGVCMVERDGYLLTVRQQHDYVVTIPVGRSYVVVEALYQHGLITNQIDYRSAYKAAEIKTVEYGKLQAHHVILAEFNVPKGTKMLNDSFMSLNSRMDGGLDLAAHVNAHDPHKQYLRVDSAATDKDIDNRSKSPKPMLLAQFWRGVDKAAADALGSALLECGEGLQGGGALGGKTKIALQKASATRLGGVMLSSAIDSNSESYAATAKAIFLLKEYADKVKISASKYTDQAIQTLLNGADPSMIRNLEKIIKEMKDNEGLLKTLTLELAKKVDNTTVLKTTGALAGGGKIGDALTLSILAATLKRAGAVQLSNDTNSTSETLAATPSAVKAVKDHADSKLPKSGGVLTGNTRFNNGVKALFGSNSDLALYFNGTAAFVDALSGFKLNFRKGNALRASVDFNDGSLFLSGDLQGLSDRRVKRNFKQLENALEKIGKLHGYDYQMLHDDAWHTGVIAQEVQQVLPNVVKTLDDGKLSVAYGNIVALLIEGINEQQAIIKNQGQRLDRLEKAVERLTK